MIWYPGFGLRKLLISITLLVILPLFYALGLFVLSIMIAGAVVDMLDLAPLVSGKAWARYILIASWLVLFFALGYITWAKFRVFMKWFIRKSDLNLAKESPWNLLK
jgi:hypothetical protein